MNSKVRITKEFHFEMAHALHEYDGKCKNIHGHSYQLDVTLIGIPESQINHPKAGMVIDFGDLKTIVNKEIIETYDHSLVLNKKGNYTHFESPSIGERLVLVDFQPTCENLLIDFSQKIITNLPDRVKLFSLRLRETSNSYAEWFASDN